MVFATDHTDESAMYICVLLILITCRQQWTLTQRALVKEPAGAPNRPDLPTDQGPQGGRRPSNNQDSRIWA